MFVFQSLIDSNVKNQSNENERDKSKDFDTFQLLSKRQYQSFLNKMLKSDLVDYAEEKGGVTVKSKDAKAKIIDKIIEFKK